MIYQVTYKDAEGNPLLEGTFSASGPREGLEILLSEPSLAPPAGATHIEIDRVDDSADGDRQPGAIVRHVRPA